jgi:hypothetical protein
MISIQKRIFVVQSILAQIIISLIIVWNQGNAQSLTGNTGLILIPTAEFLNDGDWTFGASVVDKRHNARFPNAYDQFACYTSLAFLPFLEVALRITRQLTSQIKEPLGDRMVSIRLQCIREKKFIPSLVLGTHDLMWVFGGTEAVHYNALYAALSKHVQFRENSINVGFHTGYGLDCIPASNHEFVGLFGGISIFYLKTVGLLLEYDTKKINGGVQIFILNHFQATIAFVGFNSISGGLNFKMNLHDKFK